MQIKHFDLPPGKTLEQLRQKQRERIMQETKARCAQNDFKIVAQCLSNEALRKWGPH